MFSPKKLKECGIEFTKVLQNAGEFVITFPGSYHAGFNHGFNIAESSNFALPHWLEIGRKAKRCICRPGSVLIDIDHLETLYMRSLVAQVAAYSMSAVPGDDDSHSEIKERLQDAQRLRCKCGCSRARPAAELISCDGCSMLVHMHCFPSSMLSPHPRKLSTIASESDSIGSNNSLSGHRVSSRSCDSAHTDIVCQSLDTTSAVPPPRVLCHLCRRIEVTNKSSCDVLTPPPTRSKSTGKGKKLLDTPQELCQQFLFNVPGEEGTAKSKNSSDSPLALSIDCLGAIGGAQKMKARSKKRRKNISIIIDEVSHYLLFYSFN